MAAGAKQWKVWGIKSGVGWERVASVLGGWKERVETGLLGLTTDADAEKSGVRGGASLVRCVGAERLSGRRLGAHDTPSAVCKA